MMMPRTPFYTVPSCFYETYKLFRSQLGSDGNISFKRWRRMPDDLKGAALYVQFYNEVTLAWSKTRSKWAVEETSVEEVLQYLTKNVDKILEDPKRYNPRYVYRVCYNALFCVNVDKKGAYKFFENEIPESFEVGESGELSWFDLVGTSEDAEAISSFESLQGFLESLEEKYQVYIEYMLGELSSNKACRRFKSLGVFHGKLSNPVYKSLALAVTCDEIGEDLSSRISSEFGKEVVSDLFEKAYLSR